MEEMFFIFDGIQSSEMGLYIMRIGETGFISTPLWGAKNVHQSVSNKRLVPYFYGVTREVIEFPPLQMVLCDEQMNPKIWTPEDRNRISKWLCHDTYKEFISSDDLGKRYYVLAEAQVDLNLINTQGYLEINFRTNSPFGFSPIYIDSYDISVNPITQTIILENKSNVQKLYNPLIEIELVNGETNIQLKNLSNGGKIMEFTDLYPNEIISIDTNNRIIKSNIFGSNPFEKFNKDIKRYWMDLVYGENLIEVTGMCKVYVKSQFMLAQ